MEVLQFKPARRSIAYWIAATLVAAFYLVTSVYIASQRLLWIDEIFTVLIARLPGWGTICKVLAEGADAMPPTYYMVVRSFDHLFGQFGRTEVAVRMPSALAVTAGLVVTFDCARRLTDGLHGLIALSLLTCSFLPYYGYEARSYGLYFMLAALSLWIWTQTRGDSRSAAVLFGAVLFLCIAVHYFAVLCLVPYAVWEILNWKPWRLPSPKMMGGLLGVLCAAAVLWGPIQAARRMVPPGFWAKPSPYSFRLAFPVLFPDGLSLIALVMAWIALVGREDRIIPLAPMPSGERVGWFFLLIPLAGYFLGQITHVFMVRYFIGTLPGVAVAFSCWLWRCFRERRPVAVGVLLLLATVGLARQALLARHPDRGDTTPTSQMLSLEDTLRNEGKQFILVSVQTLYLEARQYSKHPEEYRLLVFPDKDPMITGTRAVGQYYPLQFWTIEDLRKHARQTALIAPFPSPVDPFNQIPLRFQGTLDALRHAGLRITIRFSIASRFAERLEVVYLE
jgi:hypothetical protein